MTEEKFTGTYLEWLKDELSGWEPFAWALVGFGFGINTMTYITQPITWVTTVSYVAIFFGMFCVTAMAAKGWKRFTDTDGRVKEKLVVGRSVNGFMGAISVLGYVIANAYVGHWWSVLDQLIFLLTIDMGMILNWRTWGRGSEGEKVKNPTGKQWLYISGVILALWAVLYPIGIALKDTAPEADSLVLAIGAVASYLYIKRYTGTYVLWLLANIVNVSLWFQSLLSGKQAALAMLFMTLFYLVASAYGKFNFRSANVGRVREVK